MLNLKSNQSVLMNKLQNYSVFNFFYQNQLKNNKDAEILVDYLINTLADETSVEVVEGISLLKSVSVEDFNEVKFDFNRLFVGPNQLLASPYASTYLSHDRVVMQNETMVVRNYYLKAGLEIENVGKVPDDYIGYELEFICYLLSKIIETSDSSQADRYHQLLKDFINLHFFKWVPAHCEDVIKHSQSKICRGMALILKGLIKEDQIFFANKGGTLNE